VQEAHAKPSRWHSNVAFASAESNPNDADVDCTYPLGPLEIVTFGRVLSTVHV
jgi:hypothetical protein